MKKRLTTIGLGLVGSVFLASIPVNAQEVAAVEAQENEVSYGDITPRKLVNLGRHGRFKAQGVPGYSKFGTAIRSGKVDATKLVSSAVAQNRLPESALQDEKFLADVSSHLKSGGCGTN